LLSPPSEARQAPVRRPISPSGHLHTDEPPSFDAPLLPFPGSRPLQRPNDRSPAMGGRGGGLACSRSGRGWSSLAAKDPDPWSPGHGRSGVTSRTGTGGSAVVVLGTSRHGCTFEDATRSGDS
ncbi:unnamed protein product, partial [Urochloa humidicola]